MKNKLTRNAVVLLAVTSILIAFLSYQVLYYRHELFLPPPDGIHPRPIVEVFLRIDDNLTKIGDKLLLKESFPRSFNLIVRLSNNSSEPSAREAFAAGVLIVLENARVKEYELGGFSGIIGVDKNGGIVSPINSSVVELFTDKLEAWQSVEAKLHLIVDNESNCVQIAYRGWIIDEDDIVLEPTSGTEEHYIARFPQEEYPSNPPDSRWAGENFMKYEVYLAEICFKG